MNSNANAVAAVLVGAYLLAITLRSAGKQRVEAFGGLIKAEGGFLKWAFAAGVLWFFATRPEIGAVGVGLITMVLLIIAIKVANDPTILKGLSSAWSTLPSSVAGVPKDVNLDFLKG